MMCPVCKRDLAPTLSICFTCGAMVNDSVREELETKIGRVSGRLERSTAVTLTTEKPLEATPIRMDIKASTATKEPPPAVRTPRGETTEFGRKKTSPTLVGFQPKTSSVPDWRLQLQNAIRQRKTDVVPSAPAVAKVPRTPERSATANPAPAPKAKPAEESPVPHENPRVAAALRRIESSRQRFLETPAPIAVPEPETREAVRSYPFNVVSRAGDFPSWPNAPQATVNPPPKPRLVTSAKAEKLKYDTNKLPPLPEVAPIASAPRVAEIDEVSPIPVSEPISAMTEAMPEPKMLPMIDDLAGEYGICEGDDDDLAAIPSRFLAGLFDTIIGTFAAGIVLSPFLLSGGEWITVSGVMTVMGVFGVVMFIYMTAAIGLRGRTIGMRLFGLEVVDAEENEYPTMHQAAVSSAVYLLSIPMLGLGFLPLLFNEERRAAHDLISGTVLVREI